MNHSSDESVSERNLEINPYAAPQSDLISPTSPHIARELFQGIRFRRSTLRMLGLVRITLGLFYLAGSVTAVAVMLTQQITLNTAAAFGIGAGLVFGIWNFVIGWGLGKCRNWGRNTAVIDCLIQMGAAITLMSLAESLSPTTGIQFLALFASAWLGAYLRIMFSPITRTACQPEVAKSALADESTRIHGLPRTIAEFAVLLFGFTGGMLTSFCMIALGSLLR